uniref:Uncharacterized protein n=1 Tax=Helianthus annuus TaxID=4232 RepID=A0A251RN33_HELAN
MDMWGRSNKIRNTGTQFGWPHTVNFNHLRYYFATIFASRIKALDICNDKDQANSWFRGLKLYFTRFVVLKLRNLN